jgi:1-acyl-sn-glycerol-3-phosphate acyltransferase
MRSFMFNVLFRTYTIGFAVLMLPLALVPGRAHLAWGLRQWARGVLALMRAIVGIRVEVRGRRHVPGGRPVVFAGKHQSECDGIILMSLVPDLAVVAMQELGQMPVIGHLLRRLEMIMVDTDGGGRQQKTLSRGARKVHAQGRSIAIYPEATLMRVGMKERYRTGVYHVARDLGVPVVPVATNIGLCWDRREPQKSPGAAVVEFLPPLAAGPDKAAFMAELERVIEAQTDALVAEGRRTAALEPRAQGAGT